jgi:hypothetical protein
MRSEFLCRRVTMYYVTRGRHDAKGSACLRYMTKLGGHKEDIKGYQHVSIHHPHQQLE